MTSTTTQPVTDRQTLPETDSADHPILFFDGVCGLCHWAVNFIMSRDPEGVFRFAPLQGETARQQLSAAELEQLSTMVLMTNTGCYRRSAAAVRILWRLGPVWRFCGGIVWLIPAPLRDLGYRCVASVRYRLFGKHETCRLPTPEERAVSTLRSLGPGTQYSSRSVANGELADHDRRCLTLIS